MGSIFAGVGDLRGKTREQIKEICDAKSAAVKEWVDDYIATRQTPVEIHSSRRFEQIAMAMVVHEDRLASVKVSTDGDESKAKWIPKSKITIASRQTEEFLLVVMPGWIVIDRKFMQAKSPQLAAGREWTAEQLEAWKRLCASRSSYGEGKKGYRLKLRYARCMKSTSPRPR